jgi:hypothetical protein
LDLRGRKWREAEVRYNFCAPSNIFRVMNLRSIRLTGQVIRMVEMRNGYKVWIGYPKGTRTLGGPRLGWDDNIRMNLSVGWV